MREKKIYRRISYLSLALASLIAAQSIWAQSTDWQPRPIQLGTSGSNIRDMSTLYCCGGTLGALVQNKRGVQYILSNNHVLAKSNKGIVGQRISQPGLVDTGCSPILDDVVANLSNFVPISFSSFNKVDAAIAKVRKDCLDPNNNLVNCVDPTGQILGLGELSNLTVTPALNMPVKKNGRTTGLTSGTILAIDVTIFVTYNRTCGIGQKVAKFVKQIMIGDTGFSMAGDSGSVVVEDCPTNPRTVGLLFAGNDTQTATFANPINPVLSKLGVSMVGASDYCTSTSSSGVAEQLQLPTSQRALENTRRVKERHEKAIFQVEGVVGTGIGLSEAVSGETVIEVYVKKPVETMSFALPKALDGVAVKIVETGEILAY